MLECGDSEKTNQIVDQWHNVWLSKLLNALGFLLLYGPKVPKVFTICLETELKAYTVFFTA